MGVLADDVINNSVMDGMNPDNIAKLIANNKQILLDLQISEADVNEWAEKTYKSAVQNNTLFRFNQMTISEQEDILEKYLNAKSGKGL
jgi:trans-aconitate methyltransferase